MSGSNEAARSGAAVSKEQWEWTKARQPKLDEQADKLIAIGEDQYRLAREQQVFQNGLSRQYNDRYWGSVAPMQDRMLADAESFDSAGRQAELAGEALADNNQAFYSARGQQARGLQRMEVHPSSGRALAMENQMSIAQAAAQANAMNKVRQAARAEGYGRKVDANAMLSGLSGFSSTAAQSANSFSNSSQGAASMGLNGLTASGSGYLSGANSAAAGLQSASQNFRSNAIESAKNPGFDAVMGLVAGGAKLAGSTYGGTGWGA
jgi:hypothetical protein